MCMKTIGVKKEVRNEIYMVAEDGESVNDTISRLLENKENIIGFEKKRKPVNRTNINLDEDVLEQLKELREDKESLGSVIVRLIQSQ